MVQVPACPVTDGSNHAGEDGTRHDRMTLLDRSFGEHQQGYELAEIRRTDGGHVVRVRIHRDAYQGQSYAVAEVLTPAMTWTRIAVAPPSTWHADTPSRSASPTPLTDLAGQLFSRAAVILHHE